MKHRTKKSLGLKKLLKENFSPETSYFRPKKSLGQNFLKSESALRIMCEAGSVTKEDVIIEIGPGKGALTSKLLEKAKKVIAVEKDRDLILILKEKFNEKIASGYLVLVQGDILEFDPKEANLKNGEYKIIANIPYNITGAIIKRFLSEVAQPSTMVLLTQKEVAMRIVASDKKESILSLSVKAYGNPKYIMKVGKRFFSPSPKVDSAIIAIGGISRKNFKSKKEIGIFFTVVKKAFAHKRKVLRKNLEGLASLEEVDKILKNVAVSDNTRAEDVPFSKWLEINRLFAKIDTKSS